MPVEYFGTEPPGAGWRYVGDGRWVKDTMLNLSSKSILIADWGLFAEWAAALARSFGQCRYFVPWASGYPKAAPAYVGEGLPGVERVATFWDYVPDADLVAFPDIYFADWQDVVLGQFGKPVFGHRHAEALELDRRGTRRLQKDLDIPAPHTRNFTGVDELASYLHRVENKWVKISTFRGDAETWHHQSWHATEIYLHHFRNRIGALADEYEFVVEDHIDGVEVGFDGWTVFGQWPEACYWGIEVKDKAYVGRFDRYDDLPQGIRDINTKMAPILRSEQSCGFCSFEFRQGRDGTAYLIDPCLRCGSPPTEGTQEAYTNLAEIVWKAAHGEMAEAKPLGTYLAMAMIHAPFALTNWVPIDVPVEDRRWLKLRNPAVLGGKLYHVPIGGEMPEIGAIAAVADSLEEAKDLVRERAERVKGYQLEIHTAALDLAQEEIDRASEYGINFPTG